MAEETSGERDSAPERTRAFIALDIGDVIRGRIKDLCERLAKGIHFTDADPKWIDPHGIHLTVKFLGNIEAAQLPAIQDAMSRVAQDAAPITFSARGLGVFPAEWKPRVLWVGVKRGAEEVTELARRLERAMEALGFPPEGRDFSPHLTLARFKSNRGVRGMMDVVKSHARFFCGETTVDRLTLFRSELRPEGARYTVLFEAPLRGARSQETEARSQKSGARSQEPGDRSEGISNIEQGISNTEG